MNAYPSSGAQLVRCSSKSDSERSAHAFHASGQRSVWASEGRGKIGSTECRQTLAERPSIPAV